MGLEHLPSASREATLEIEFSIAHHGRRKGLSLTVRSLDGAVQ